MLTTGACDRKASSGSAAKAGPKLERQAEGTPAKAASKDGPQADEKAAAADKKPAAAKADTAAKPTAAADTKAQAKAAAPGPEATKTPPAKAVEAKSKVTAEECQKACDNVLKISVADMKKTAPKVRAAIEKRVKDDCPKQCLKHGSKASVDCLAAATTASALAACPR